MNNQLNKCASDPEDEARAFALRMYTDVIFTNNVLNACIQLHLFDIIAQAGPGAQLSASEISTKLSTKNPERAAFFLDRILRHLASYDLLTCSLCAVNAGVERRYGISLPGKFFVRSEDGDAFSSFPPIEGLVKACSHFKDFILEGHSNDLFMEVNGISIYQHIKQDVELAKGFGQSMSDYSKLLNKDILEKYKGFEGITSLLDVGGGNGVTLNMIVSKYPSIKAINYDQPQVVQNAPSYPGVKHVGGNMFETIPKSENLMMKDILHNWDDETCLKLLKNCYNALPPMTGKLIVLSYVMPEEAETSNAAKYVSNMDILMFMFGGRQRTEREHKALGKAAGFSGFQLCYCAFHGMGVMEFHK